MKKLSLVALVASIALITGVAMANVPAPPVNQILGFDDTEFNALTEADCRVCHDSGMPDRHHMLYGSAMIGPGTCSEATGLCDISGTDCVVDTDCPVGEVCVDGTPGACYINDECATYTNLCTRGEPCGSCSVSGDECGQDVDCPVGETCVGACPTYRGVPGQCGQPVCGGGSMAPNNPNAGVYGCLTCHDEDNTGGVINFVVYRDCTFCHEYRGGANVHHLDSDFTGAKAGNCVVCHGDIVDNPVGCDENVAGNCSIQGKACAIDADCPAGETCVPGTCDHDIPTYEPSLVTPAPAGSAFGADVGTCDYCHAPGLDTASGVEVHDNHDTHHHVGFYYYADGTRESWCNWCHLGGRPGQEPPGMEDYAIRTCENCHGPESLHNIQVDSDGDCCVNVGEELYGYGHVGADDPGGDSDCWGCHGFSMAAAPGSGPTAPSISSIDPPVMTAGTATQVTVLGSALTNTLGALEWTSQVVLTAQDGSTTELTPDTINSCLMTVTIPESMSAGNYELRAVKDDLESGRFVISVIPEVEISEVTCSKCLGTMTITGVGFSEKPEGTDEDMSVTEGGRPLNIISWTDTSIEVSGARCTGDLEVTTLFGSATTQQ
jgi:hypothetical protein